MTVTSPQVSQHFQVQYVDDSLQVLCSQLSSGLSHFGATLHCKCFDDALLSLMLTAQSQTFPSLRQAERSFHRVLKDVQKCEDANPNVFAPEKSSGSEDDDENDDSEGPSDEDVEAGSNASGIFP